MNKNSIKILPIFLALPFVMAMYNGPHFYESDISYYDLTYVSHEQIDEQYVYTCNFKNNSADVYISSISLSGTLKNENYQFSLYKNGFSDIFNNSYCVLAPQYEGIVKLYSEKEITDLSEFDKDGNGFSLSDSSINKINVYTSNIESITLNQIDSVKPSSSYYYTIKFNENVKNIYSCGLFEMKYNGETVYLMMESSKEGYRFSTSEQLDLNKLTVEGVTLVETYRPFSINVDKLGELTAIFVAIMVVIHVGIFCAIFFPIRHTLRKRRKAKADNQQ